MHAYVVHVHNAHAHAVHAHVTHGHIMHAYTVYSTVCLTSELISKCQLHCFKFNTSAKVGMSLKINSGMPTFILKCQFFPIVYR
jgi:hypothetical protein